MQRQILARRIGIASAVALTVYFVAAPAHACLGGYRGPDWQVGNSPLILIGTIEKVEPGKIVSGIKYRAPFDGGGESHRTPATIATVRITRILKGKYADAHIRIGGGPIHNSCDDDWFYDLKVGEQELFILPYYPIHGEVALEWSGSIRKLSDTSMVESRVARGVAFREAYLADLQREQPAAYATGTRLAREIRDDAKTWPEEKFDRKGNEAADFVKASKRLQEKLATIDVEAIRAALAFDWLADDCGYWWRRSLWREAISTIENSRAREMDVVEDQWIRRTLACAGIAKEHTDKYIAAIQKSGLHGHLCFPYQPSTDWSFFHEDYRGGAEILSTDLILRYHCYDRNAMLHAYAGDLDSSILANIFPKRVKNWVDSLYRNDDERLRWVAERIIAQSQGTDFVDLILTDMLEEERPFAWRILDDDEKLQETGQRLCAMIDLAVKEYNGYWQAVFWGRMRSGHCFHPACIDKAVAALEELEKRGGKRADKDEGPSDENHQGRVIALRDFLAAAQEDRRAAPAPKTTAAEYRRWFKDHPLPPKGN
jgi:hypothetical protein